jgi:hypothetical protein
MAQSIIEKIQAILDLDQDGIWGLNSQTALNKEVAGTGADPNPVLMKIQKLLGVDDDGFWGPISQQALNDQQDSGGGSSGGGFTVTASSFADLADVRAFKRCKAEGKTDQQCFKVGDNGIGQFGKITAQEDVAMVAVHKDDMIARWGSVLGAAHRPVTVTIGGRTIDATVEDRIGVKGRIDLNPAAAKQLGLTPPFLVEGCVWNWA